MNKPRVMARQSVRIALIAAILFVAVGCGAPPSNPSPDTPPGTLWTFVALGDTKNSPLFPIHVRHIASLDPAPEFVLHLGDLVSQYDLDAAWKDFHDVARPLVRRFPLHPVPGNHDVGPLPTFGEIYGTETGVGGARYYSFTIHDALFIALSTEEPECVDAICGAQLEWLQARLAAPGTSRIVVFCHRPPFPQGHYLGAGLRNAEELHAMFVAAGVDLVFSGHEHQFFFRERDGVAYVISGGGGATIDHENGGDFYHYVRACVAEDAATLQVIGLDGKEMERHEIPFN